MALNVLTMEQIYFHHTGGFRDYLMPSDSIMLMIFMAMMTCELNAVHVRLE